MSDSPAIEWTEFVSESELSESESRSLIKAVYWLAATAAITFLALLLGCVVVLIDDCLPGLSEFKDLDYWRVDYWCLSGTVEYWYSVSTGGDTDTGRFWCRFGVVMQGGAGIENGVSFFGLGHWVLLYVLHRV